MNIIGVTGHAGSGKDEVARRFVEKHKYTQLSLADPIKRFALNVFGFDVIQLWGPSSVRNTFDPMFHECDIRSKNIEFGPGCNMVSIKRVCDPGWFDAACRLTEYAPTWINSLVKESVKQQEALEMLYFWFASLGHHYPAISPRIVLQYLGAEWGREVVSKDIWIDKLLETSVAVLGGVHYEKETGNSKQTTFDVPTGIVVSDVRFSNELTKLKEVGGKIIRITRKTSDIQAKYLGVSNHISEVEQKDFTDDMFDSILQNEKTLKELYSAVDIVAAAFNNTKESN